MSGPNIELYVRKNCDKCKEAEEIVGRVGKDVPFTLKSVDIASSEDLFRRYKQDVPMIFINGKKSFKFRVSADEFRNRVRKEIIKAGISKVMKKKKAVAKA